MWRAIVLFLITLAPGGMLLSQFAQPGFRNEHPTAEKRLQMHRFEPSSTSSPDGQKFDVTYYKLDLVVSVSPQYLRGAVTVSVISASDSLDMIILDLSGGMKVDSVTVNDKTVNVVRYSSAVGIPLDRAYRSGEIATATVYYEGVPDPTGFGSFVFGRHQNESWVWSLSEPYGARDWWPCKDQPLDKADSVDVQVTCPAGFKVASNGRLSGVTDNGNGTVTYRWSERYPIATYLVSIALTNYTEFSDWYHYSLTDSMQILNYVLPEHLDSARAGLSVTVPALTIYSRLFGPFPFLKEKYGHAEFGQGGAMEHQTMTSTVTFDELTIVHELAHQWFGDLITCANWANLWLNEGFATYCEALYLEMRYGEDAYRSYMDGTLSLALGAPGTLIVQDTSDVRNLFNNTRVYAKGGSLLHMLRHVLGDSVFFGSLRAYASDPRLRYSNATTADFRQVCEQTSGKSLAYFFNEWAYGESFPRYSFRWSSTRVPDGYLATVALDQVTGTSNPSYFTMPVDIRFSGPGWDTTVVVLNDGPDQQYTFHLKEAPASAAFDPGNWILKEMVDPNELLPTGFSLAQNFPNPFNAGTTIPFRVPHRSEIALRVYNILGEEVAMLVNGRLEAGTHTAQWNGSRPDGRPLPSGIYFYRLVANSYQNTRMMLLLK